MTPQLWRPSAGSCANRSLLHEHAALVHVAATKLGLPALLGPACRGLSGGDPGVSGNTADPAAFTGAVEVVHTKFELSRLTLVLDRG